MYNVPISIPPSVSTFLSLFPGSFHIKSHLSTEPEIYPNTWVWPKPFFPYTLKPKIIHKVFFSLKSLKAIYFFAADAYIFLIFEIKTNFVALSLVSILTHFRKTIFHLFKCWSLSTYCHTSRFIMLSNDPLYSCLQPLLLS